MLNTFPELLSFSLISPLILRVVLGMIFLNLGYLKLGREKEAWIRFLDISRIRPASFWLKIVAFIQIIGGLMLVAGFYTQVAALVFSVITLLEIYVENREPILLSRNFVFYLLLFVISLSLLLSGAGIFAVDLPL